MKKAPVFERKIPVNATMTPSQHKKFKALGGSRWLQWAIDEAPAPVAAKKKAAAK
jgi:hypothetical protein